jgi:hypothetical protein
MGMSCGGRGVRCENGEVGRAAVTRIGSCMGCTRGYTVADHDLHILGHTWM